MKFNSFEFGNWRRSEPRDRHRWGLFSKLRDATGIHRPGGWLRVLKLSFFAMGALALIYVGLVIVDAAVVQMVARRELKTSILKASSLAPGSVVASLNSPRIGLSTMVLEGTDKRTLRRGAGRLTGSGLLGEAGNIVIAGHRDTVFRPLQDLRVGDEIFMTSPLGTFRYQVAWTRTVNPDQTEALQSTPQSTLTLVTCYPFSYIGPAPKRMLVRAVLMEQKAP